MSALQRKTLLRNAVDAADSEARRKREEKEEAGPWRPGVWQKASEAILNGTWKEKPPPREPILLTPDGPISSAAKLQKLAEMESLPEVIVTSQVDVYDRELKKVTICDISYAEWERVQEKADVSIGIVEGIMVMFKGKRRWARIVKALKEGVVLEDEDEDQEGSVPERKAGDTATGPQSPPT